MLYCGYAPFCVYRLCEVLRLSSVNLWVLFLISAEVKMPSGKIDKPVIQDNRDGTVSVKYDPREEGSHELVVKYNGEPVQGKQGRVFVPNWLNPSLFTTFRISVQIPRGLHYIRLCDRLWSWSDTWCHWRTSELHHLN